jgi:hypothetical protein
MAEETTSTYCLGQYEFSLFFVYCAFFGSAEFKALVSVESLSINAGITSSAR